MEDLQQFKDNWLSYVDDAVSPTEKGRLFIDKLIADWLEPSDAMESWYCDGPNDGGIDYAILIEADSQESNNDTDEPVGNIWYVVQSKYGNAFQGNQTLWSEAEKFFRTLHGDTDKLSQKTKDLINKLHNFIKGADPERDRLMFTFALSDEISELEAKEIDKIRNYGRDLFQSKYKIHPAIFDVTVVTIGTIYNRIINELDYSVSVELNGSFVKTGDMLLIGSTSVIDFYEFLREYRNKTNDLDRIFEKNVRKSLGGQVKVNKGIRSTLQEAPEKFGLFNNGVTIAVTNFEIKGDRCHLDDPYIVNGCQTTSSIWSVCDCNLSTGASNKSPEVVAWEKKAKSGYIIIKVVKTGKDGNDLLSDITKYTNSQNAVRDKDFIALSNSFQSWREKLKKKYKIFLEIQKGGWDAEKFKGVGRRSGSKYTGHANAIELMKVYGAGWLNIPGIAYGKNAPFAPGGHVYKQVTDSNSDFDETDLYAAYLVLQSADKNEFNRTAMRESRHHTKYLYCFLLVYIIRAALEERGRRTDNKSISKAIVHFKGVHKLASDGACEIIDQYMRRNERYGIENEAGWKRSINNYLKAESFGKDLLASQNLKDLLTDKTREFRRNDNFMIIVDDIGA